MPLRRIFSWLKSFFRKRRAISLGFYGAPNVGKTTLANKICKDWTGKEMGKVSVVPHETRAVQKKEHVSVKLDGRELDMNLLDMPGIATKVDYRDFIKYGLNKKESLKRAKEATKGIIEAIKWLEDVDVALVVMDSTQDPFTQVNLTILANLEARKIPVIIVANKIDLKSSRADRIKDAFPQHRVVEISALRGDHIKKLYKVIGEVAR